MTDSLDILFDDISNPLDGVEDLLQMQKWDFNRMNRDELFVETKGRHCDYRMIFVWDEGAAALQFCCEYDLVIGDHNRSRANDVLSDINCQVWLGHFEIARGQSVPCFRHTQLFRGMTQGSGAEHLQDLMQIAIGECDRHYMAFAALSQEITPDEETLSLAMMPAIGNS